MAGLDQLLLNEFAEKFISANKLWERRFEKEASEKKTTNIFCLGNQLYYNDRADLPGKNIKIARSIFENTNLEPYKEKLSDFDAVLTGSSWNKQLLENLTQKEIKVIHEGVDDTVFLPTPKSGLLPEENFYIFFRGQDRISQGTRFGIAGVQDICRASSRCPPVAWRSRGLTSV